jgi:MOSC domain-containing protein YiiM
MSDVITHRSTEQLTAGLDDVRRSPADGGALELIVARPAPAERTVLDEATLTLDDGLHGDNWRSRKNRRDPDAPPEVNRQLTLMNARAIALFAPARDAWPLAGDQLYVDLDLSRDNLPTGTRLQIGDAVIEVTPEPHTGCAKFAERFGIDAARFVNSPEGSELRLRGINARVIVPGTIKAGDAIVKQP